VGADARQQLWDASVTTLTDAMLWSATVLITIYSIVVYSIIIYSIIAARERVMLEYSDAHGG
jgi:hypothetical protein